MRLRFAIALLAIAVLAGVCSAADSEMEIFQPIYLKLLITGDTKEARQQLEPLADTYEKVFLMSCIEMTDGNLDKAKSYAEQMIAMKPEVPDGKVLLGLINRRMAAPDESWVESYLSAWKAEGSPKLAFMDFDNLLGWLIDDGGGLHITYYPETLAAVRESPDELLVSYATGITNSPAKSIEMALKYSAPNAPLGVRLLALSELNINYEEISGEIRQNAESRKSKLIHQLAEELPSVMLYDLMILVEETSDREVFDEADISRLEEIAKRKKLSLSMPELYKIYKRRFQELGLDNRYFQASTAANTYNAFSTNNVKDKILTTAENASEEVRLRLAAVLDKIGKAHMSQKTAIDFFIANNFFRQAAKLQGEKDSLDRIEEIDIFIISDLSLTGMYGAFSTMYWPIRSLNIEAIDSMMENEVRYFLLFTDTPMPDELKKYLE
jgi:hypothetical protein